MIRKLRVRAVDYNPVTGAEDWRKLAQNRAEIEVIDDGNQFWYYYPEEYHNTTPRRVIEKCFCEVIEVLSEDSDREKRRRSQLVDDLVSMSLFCSHKKEVGAVIKRLKGEDAERVKTLTADDFNHPNRLKII